MPLTTTHALVPLAGAILFSSKPFPSRLAGACVAAAAAPDLDALVQWWWRLAPGSVYSHRGAAHSLFVALAAGLLAAIFHKPLKAGPLAAGTAVAASMASHGLLDMMTNSGRPVAYLWPLTSQRLFADWRPIHSTAVHLAHWFRQAFPRQEYELWHIILPMFALALGVRGGVAMLKRARAP